MKKTLKYLLIAAMIVLAGAWSMVNAMPQGIAKEPQIDMHSTSVMVGSGSHLPQAAIEGTTTTEDENNGSIPKGGPRKGRPGDWEHPVDDPIGDAMIPLALLAAAYALLRVYRRKRRV